MRRHQDKIHKEEMKKKKEPSHGGKRKGAGRPSDDDPKVKIIVRVVKSKEMEARSAFQEIADRLNRPEQFNDLKPINHGK